MLRVFLDGARFISLNVTLLIKRRDCCGGPLSLHGLGNSLVEAPDNR